MKFVFRLPKHAIAGVIAASPFGTARTSSPGSSRNNRLSVVSAVSLKHRHIIRTARTSPPPELKRGLRTAVDGNRKFVGDKF